MSGTDWNPSIPSASNQNHGACNMKASIACGAAAPAFFAIALAFLPGRVLADFRGSDPLDSMSPNWKVVEACGGGKLVFQHSRMEYRVKDPTTDDKAVMRWTSNEGDYQKDWYVQVAVHLEDVSLKELAGVSLALSVVNPKRRDQRYVIAYERYRSASDPYTFYWNAISGGTNDPASLDLRTRDEEGIALRIHFDHRAKTLTGSFNPGFGWVFLKPASISEWGMAAGDTFAAMLEGGSSRGARIGPVIESGDAYFTNFRAGSALPDIVVSRPPSRDLTSGAKRSFGTVGIGKGRQQTYNIRNNGTARLTNLAIQQDGPNTADFRITGPAKIHLRPGDITTFVVTFSPKGTGTRNSLIRISCNDPNENPFAIRLTGMGVK